MKARTTANASEPNAPSAKEFEDGFELYAPLNVVKPIVDDVFIVDGQLIRMGFGGGISVPFTTRMTILRLSSGDLFVISPTTFSLEVANAVSTLGRVAHLVSSNFIHYAHIAAWKSHFPEAIAWAAPGVRERAKQQRIDVAFDRDLADGPDDAWSSEIDQFIFEGSRVIREVVFFHKASKTLVLTDLIENFEMSRVPARWRWLLRLAGAAHPDGKAPVDMRLTFSLGKAEARASRDRLIAWAPSRVIMAHGKIYDDNGTEELRRAFRWLD